MSLRRRTAGTLAQSLPLLAPPERSVWAEAMRAEVAHIEDDGQALAFAAGCAWAGARLHLYTALGWMRLARLGVAGAGAALGVGCLYMVLILFRAREAEPAWVLSAAAAFVLLAPLHLGAALNLAAWRPERLGLFAGAALALNLLAYAGLAFADLLGAPPVHARFYTALVAEQLGWIAVVFAAGVALLILKPRLERAR